MKTIKPILVVVLLGSLLAACSLASTQEATSIPTDTIQVPSPQVQPTQGEPTCIPNPPPPTPSAQDLEVFTPDPEKDWILGPEDAPITIIEYADFQCPYCSLASENLANLLEKYPDDVRLVYRHFPLVSIHDKALSGVRAAEAAGRQSTEAFWAMHDLLYQTQSTWSDDTPEQFDSWVLGQAEDLGLDPVQFEADYNSQELIDLAQAAWENGQALGLPGTPYLKVNSVYEAQADPELLTAFVEMIKLQDQQYTACPPMTVDPDRSYQAVVETEKGDIVIKLFPDVAPLAVNSFIYLAENGWFDGVTFHRVLPGYVAQTGDPTGTGYGGPGYRFSNETSDALTFDRAGLVAMANAGPDSNGSQFFITYDALPDLNGGYTIFGEVVEGMDVVEDLTPRDPQSGTDLPPGDRILHITIEEQ